MKLHATQSGSRDSREVGIREMAGVDERDSGVVLA